MIEIKWVWENLKGYRKRYLLCLFLHITMSLLALVNPKFSQRLIDDVLLGGDKTLLIPLVAAMCAVTFLRTGIGYSMQALLEFTVQGFVQKMRLRMYENFQRQDMSFYSSNPTGDLMTAMMSDVDMVRHSVTFVFRQLLSGVVLFVGACIFIFTTNWKFALCMIALTPLIFIVTYIYNKKVREIYIELRRRLSMLNTAAQENIEGNRVVKAFANESFEITKFNERSDAYRQQNLVAQRTWLKYFPYIEGLAQNMMVTTLLFGGIFLIRGDLTGGEYMAISSLSWAITDPLRQLGTLLNDLQHFFASAMKMMGMLGTTPRVLSPAEPKAPVRDGGGTGVRMKGDIEFRGVGFRFDKTPVLSDINFHIKPGETYALMGETGSGKTMIADLISRFYDVKEGEILIDGVDIRDWDLRALRSSIGMTTQEIFLFSDTVDGNIAYGSPDMPEEDVRKFAHISAAQFIDGMTEGYDTIIGERGVGLSGGQKQRIALARALAIRPSVLILDDTTSAVDMETEKYIQEQLAKLDIQCTKLIIAQRISSVKKADCILLLKDGRVAERGTHEELLAKRGLYFDLWLIQTGAGELPEFAGIVAGGGAAGGSAQ